MSSSLSRLALVVGVLGTVQIIPSYPSVATTPATQMISSLHGASREYVAKVLLLPAERREYEISRKEIWLYPNGQQVVFHHGAVAAEQVTAANSSPTSPNSSSSSKTTASQEQDDKLAYDIFREIQTLASTAAARGNSGNTPSPPNARLRVPPADDEFSEESEE